MSRLLWGRTIAGLDMAQFAELIIGPRISRDPSPHPLVRTVIGRESGQSSIAEN
jgi:hypothetical protein